MSPTQEHHLVKQDSSLRWHKNYRQYFWIWIHEKMKIKFSFTFAPSYVSFRLTSLILISQPENNKDEKMDADLEHWLWIESYKKSSIELNTFFPAAQKNLRQTFVVGKAQVTNNPNDGPSLNKDDWQPPFLEWAAPYTSGWAAARSRLLCSQPSPVYSQMQWRYTTGCFIIIHFLQFWLRHHFHMSAESKYSKITFSISYFRYMSTSIFYQNYDFSQYFGKK